jgi:hypothetical protein
MRETLPVTVQKIDSIEDRMNGVVTYALSTGERLRVDAGAVAAFGIRAVLDGSGYKMETPRALPVRQCGHIVGTLSSDFDPALAKSRSWLYDPRPGDFRRQGDEWIAAPMLGPGDLEAAGVILPTPDSSGL